MRNLIIIVVIAAILYFGYRAGKKAIDNFDIGDPKFIGADLASVFSGSSFTTIDLGTTITNKNNFSVSVSGLYVEVYYQGAILGKSTKPHDKFIIPANGSVDLTENITIALGNAAQIAGRLISKQPTQFDYMVKAKLFGFFPLTVRDSFTYS